MEIRKKIRWCMAHKLPNHHELHGHSYELEIILDGLIHQDDSSVDDGLVIDFKLIESIAKSTVIDLLDRGCIISEKDVASEPFLKIQDQIKLIVVPFVPSSEMIVQWLFEKLEHAFATLNIPGLKLKELTLWDSDTTAVTYRHDSFL